MELTDAVTSAALSPLASVEGSRAGPFDGTSNSPQGPPGGPRAGLSDCWRSARCIAHLDADCFYAQVEELADPSLRFRLLAVRQKNLVVTCSLRTRAAIGNIKGANASEALRRWPSLHISNGEDLAKYRRVSDRMLQLLQGQPWRGDPSTEPSRGPCGLQRPSTANADEGGGSPCCSHHTVAARAAWSAVSASVASEAAASHPVQRLGLDDFFVDLTSAARTVTASLVASLFAVCHPLGVSPTSKACTCTLRATVAAPQQQPRVSGVLLPSLAIRCRSCSSCGPHQLHPPLKPATTSAAYLASADRQRAEEDKWRHSCCEWELLCPAFVYEGREENHKPSSRASSNNKSNSNSSSANRLLQRPLHLAPLVDLLKKGEYLPPLLMGPSGEGVSTSKGGSPQQPRHQEERFAATGCRQGKHVDVGPHYQGGRPSRCEEQQAAGASQGRCCPDGKNSSCGVQRLLLVVAAHLTEAMRGLIFSTFGGLTTTGGISSNKTLAKMASKTHKPSQQTLLLREHRRCFLAGKQLRSLPGIGAATSRRLAAANVKTCTQLLSMSSRDLACLLSDAALPSSSSPVPPHTQQLLPLRRSSMASPPPSRVSIEHAERLRLSCMGDEAEPVQESSCAFKTVTAEDSYAVRPITTWVFLREEVNRLLRRLLQRHTEIVHRFGLVASSLRVSARLRDGYQRPSRSATLPCAVRSLLKAASIQKSSACDFSMRSSQKSLANTFNIPAGKEGREPAPCQFDSAGSEQGVQTAAAPEAEDPIRVALLELALELLGRTLRALSPPGQIFSNGVTVLSLTFAGFEPHDPHKVPLPAARNNRPCARYTMEAFVSRTGANQRHQKQKRERDTAKGDGAPSPFPSTNPEEPIDCDSDASEEKEQSARTSRQSEERHEGRVASNRLGEAAPMSLSSSSNVSHDEEGGGEAVTQPQQDGALAAEAAAGCSSWASSDSPTVVLNASSRESSPDTYAFVCNQTDGPIRAQDTGVAASPFAQASAIRAIDKDVGEVEECRSTETSQKGGAATLGVRRLAPSRHGSCEVILVESQGSAEQVTLSQSADGLVHDQQVADRTVDRPNPTDNNRRERDTGGWDVSSDCIKPLPPGIQKEAPEDLHKGEKRRLVKHSVERSARQSRKKTRSNSKPAVDLTHFFARK